MRFVVEGGASLFAGRRDGMQPGARNQLSSLREGSPSRVSMSVLDQADNLRRLVLPDDDSAVSSSAYPCSTLLGGIHRKVLRDRLSLPLHQFEGQSPRWGGCITRASRGEELHLYSIQVIKDLISLSPSALVLPPFRGNGSQDGAVEIRPAPFHFDVMPVGGGACPRFPAGARPSLLARTRREPFDSP